MGDPTKAEQELQLCLDDVESGADLRYADGVRDEIATLARDKFIKNEDQWATQGQNVRRAEKFVGRFAHLFAEFDGETKLRPADVTQAIFIMKGLCQAKLVEAGLPSDMVLFFAWCPDNPGPPPLSARTK